MKKKKKKGYRRVITHTKLKKKRSQKNLLVTPIQKSVLHPKKPKMAA